MSTLRPIATSFVLIGAVLIGAAVARPRRASAQDGGTDKLSEMMEKIFRESEEQDRRFHEKAKKDRTASGARGAWAVSEDAATIAAGTPAGKIEVWTRGEPKPAFVLEGHGDLVESLAFGRGSTILYSVGYEGTLKTWDLTERKLAGTLGRANRKPAKSSREALEQSLDRYRSVFASPDGRYMAGMTAMLSLWDRKAAKWVDPRPSGLLSDAVFLADSRRLVVSNSGGVELHDLLAPPVKDKESGELDAAAPLWRLRAEGSMGFDFGTQAKAKPTELGAALITRVAVFDPADAVVTLSRYRGSGPGGGGKWGSVLRAWNAKDGRRLWEKSLGTEDTWVCEARASAFVPVESPTGIAFHSPKDGALVRSVPFAEGRPKPSILAPDASAGFTADKDGNLIEISLAPPPAPPGKTPPPK